MSKKKKVEKIGTIDALELLKKTREPQNISFKTGGYQTKKDRPRNKNWKKWSRLEEELRKDKDRD